MKKRKLSTKIKLFKRVIITFNRDYDLHRKIINRYTTVTEYATWKNFERSLKDPFIFKKNIWLHLFSISYFDIRDIELIYCYFLVTYNLIQTKNLGAVNFEGSFLQISFYLPIHFSDLLTCCYLAVLSK